MSRETQEEARRTGHLLGELPEAERERLEEALFADDEAFEQMLVAEDDLIDAYARGELSAEERRRFEERFLSSPDGRERVQFARSLADAVADARPVATTAAATPSFPPARLFGMWSRGAALRFALPAAALVVVAALTWSLFERARMSKELRQLRAERTALSEKAQELERRAAAEQARSAEMLAQLEAARARPTPEAVQRGAEVVAQQSPPRADRVPRGRVKKNDEGIARRTPEQGRQIYTPLNTANTTLGNSAKSLRPEELPLQSSREVANLRLRPPRIVSFELTPGLVRGGGPNTLAVPRNVDSILLTLTLETASSHDTYRAVIETAERRPVWRVDSVAAANRTTINLLEVPASKLPPGDYVLSLSGRRPDGGFEGVADYSFRIVRSKDRR